MVKSKDKVIYVFAFLYVATLIAAIYSNYNQALIGILTTMSGVIGLVVGHTYGASTALKQPIPQNVLDTMVSNVSSVSQTSTTATKPKDDVTT